MSNELERVALESVFFDNEAFFAEGEQPENWLKMAVALKHTASLLDWTLHPELPDWRYVPIYRMLMAFSIENLLKGIWIAEGQPAIEGGILSDRLSKHGLRHYADGVKASRLRKLNGASSMNWQAT